MTRRRLFISAVLVGVIGMVGLARAGDPHVGTWKLNAEKSKGTPFKSGTVTIEPAGEGLKATVDLLGTDGAPSKWGFTANFDGKDYPITGTTLLGNSVALTRVDERTARATYKQGGTITVTQTAVVSDDGKTRTVTTKGTNTKGQNVDSMTFYEKQ